MRTAPEPSAAGRRVSAARREQRLVRLALAVVAVAIVDDAFVHPEPGTGAGDHIVSGLVPLAVVGVVAAVYPRMRAGARATVGVIVGSLAAVAGIAERPHVTAMLAGLAGAWLLCLGLVTLWRTRRRDERRRRRYIRRSLAGIAALAVGVFVVLPVGIAIVATHRARSAVSPADLGRPHERVALTTSDGLELAGWYVPSRNRAAVIVFPGRSGGTVPHARLLVRHGYGVLLLDRRGEGASDGDFNAFGWGGEPDLRAAIGFLGRRPDVDPERIGGLGLSVGGELLLQTAARDSRLHAVISEGAGARSLAEQLDTPGVPRWMRPLSPWLAQTAALAVLSDGMPPPGLGDLVRDIDRPVLLIQARFGQGGEELNAVYAANGAPAATRWIAAGGHTGALAAAPREYERRVIDFLDRALSAHTPNPSRR